MTSLLSVILIDGISPYDVQLPAYFCQRITAKVVKSQLQLQKSHLQPFAFFFQTQQAKGLIMLVLFFFFLPISSSYQSYPAINYPLNNDKQMLFCL